MSVIRLNRRPNAVNEVSGVPVVAQVLVLVLVNHILVGWRKRKSVALAGDEAAYERDRLVKEGERLDYERARFKWQFEETKYHSKKQEAEIARLTRGRINEW
eukprot:SAG22_NODE_7195_length_763_cov_2.868976_1_plen_102_part_00